MIGSDITLKVAACRAAIIHIECAITTLTTYSRVYFYYDIAKLEKRAGKLYADLGRLEGLLMREAQEVAS